uniref:CUB domain-containing protein n=1 Tax=Biomphalaria glabrata TaxID=6526 RepID=A0A2C9LXX6_BIOGL
MVCILLHWSYYCAAMLKQYFLVVSCLLVWCSARVLESRQAATQFNVCATSEVRVSQGSYIELKSPNYPRSYLDNTHCRVTLRSGPKALALSLRFSEFQLENQQTACSFDSLCIYGVKFCGSWATGRVFQYILPSNSNFTLDFLTDSSGTFRGFDIVVSAALYNNETVNVTSGGVGSSSGTLQSQLLTLRNLNYQDKCKNDARIVSATYPTTSSYYVTTPLYQYTTNSPLYYDTTTYYQYTTYYPWYYDTTTNYQYTTNSPLYYDTTTYYQYTTNSPLYYDTTTYYQYTTNNPWIYDTTLYYQYTTNNPWIYETTTNYQYTTNSPLYYDTTTYYQYTTYYPWYYDTTANYQYTTNNLRYYDTTTYYQYTTYYPWYYDTTTYYQYTTNNPWIYETTTNYQYTTNYPWYYDTTYYQYTTNYPWYYDTTTYYQYTTGYPYYYETTTYNPYSTNYPWYEASTYYPYTTGYPWYYPSTTYSPPFAAFPSKDYVASLIQQVIQQLNSERYSQEQASLLLTQLLRYLGY